jgi:hypothetical protein
MLPFSPSPRASNGTQLSRVVIASDWTEAKQSLRSGGLLRRSRASQ